MRGRHVRKLQPVVAGHHDLARAEDIIGFAEAAAAGPAQRIAHPTRIHLSRTRGQWEAPAAGGQAATHTAPPHILNLVLEQVQGVKPPLTAPPHILNLVQCPCRQATSSGGGASSGGQSEKFKITAATAASLSPPD